MAIKNTSTYILLLITINLVYLFTFIDKIGLHGDEAYFGLEAIDIIKHGISKAYGLNKYTGILQSLINSISFQIWKIDIISLRISGILCNAISLVLIIKILIKRLNRVAALVFLLLFTQSIILICYSKVAWEVCSFNFLFITVSLFSIHKLSNKTVKAKNLLSYIFLGVTLLGSYNHILFSSIIFAMLISMVLWLFANKTTPSFLFLRCFTLTFISFSNSVFLFLFMNYALDEVWNELGFITCTIPVVLIIIEIVLFRKAKTLLEVILKYPSTKNKLSNLVKFTLPLLLTLAFIKIHSATFMDILANKVLLLRLFSYQLPTLLHFYFSLTALFIIGFTLYNLIIDLFKKTTSIWTYFIFTYLGILCLYTQGFSIRYFHILTIFTFLYLSQTPIINNKKIKLLLILILTINVILVQSTLWYINLNSHTKVKALKFKIGISHYETSAHFLNFSPVIDFTLKNNIGIIHTDDKFFIGNVFEFYKHVNPEIRKYNNSATINYNYKEFDSGFTIKDSF